MGDTILDREELEDRWRKRVTDAKLRLDLARNYVKEVQRDLPRDDIPAPDGDYAYRKALHAENSALAEYKRVLRIFTDLTVNGKIPDEDDWLWRKGTRRGDSD
jgi:hypothetical protein